MLFRQRAAHADDVHDREHLRAPEIILLYRAEIGKQSRYVRRAAQKTGRRARADHAVELAGLEHRGQRLFLRYRLEVYFRRQLERGALFAAGILDAAAAPVHIAHVHAVLVVQDAADPDVRGDLVFGQAERLAFQVLRAPDAAIGADVDARVPEQTGNIGGDRDIVGFAARDLQRVAGERKLADVELAGLERAMEGFFRLDRGGDHVAGGDAHAPVEQGARAVVVAARQADGELRHRVIRA